MSTAPSDSDEPPQEPDDVEAESGRKQKRTEAKGFLWKAVNELPEDCKTVILLRQQTDLNFGEIAEQMDRSSDAVRMLWGRAIMMLGEKFEEKE